MKLRVNICDDKDCFAYAKDGIDKKNILYASEDAESEDSNSIYKNYKKIGGEVQDDNIAPRQNVSGKYLLIWFEN